MSSAEKTESTNTPLLSFIIPAYNEEQYLRETLTEVSKILRKKAFTHEIIVVDDGSTDKTSEILAEFPKIHSIRNDTNQGKGFSVRRGMLEASGQFRVFYDADMSVSMMELDNLLPKLAGWPSNSKDGTTDIAADVAIGTRRAIGARIAKRQPVMRHLSGLAYGKLVKSIFGLDFADCQCGFKGFTAEAATRLFGAQTVTGFTFDTELLVIAREWDLKVAEVPVVWWDRPGTTLSAGRHAVTILRELNQIRKALHKGQYGK